ncbi:SDR family oxidoreductase [Nonomuraea sp. NPDC049714]|uniref:SDR family oxidoreductase n=1 Tax=Nonomuraea sp. NPDC049714 TaxID=3364357 RepID=UPI0037B28763
MRIVLAGATGVIGRRVVPRLVAGGHQVIALTRKPDRTATLRALGAEPVVADVHDRAAIVTAVRAAAPDLVMHQLTDLAAGDVVANAALRREGTRNLVDAALAAGARRMVAQRLAADDEVVSFVHADDAAIAAVQALTWPAGHAVNVCDDEPVSGREWVPAFCAAVGAPPPPTADPGRPGWARGADNH